MKAALFRVGLIVLVLSCVGLYIAYSQIPEYRSLVGALNVLVDGKAAARLALLLDVKRYSTIGAGVGLLLAVLMFDTDWLKRKRKEDRPAAHTQTVALPRFCNQCNAENKARSRYCRKCGAELD